MNKSTIILIADSPILNPKFVKPITNLSIGYTAYLHSLLYLNWIEILETFKKNFNLISILSEKDKDYTPKDFLNFEFKNIFYGNLGLKLFLEDILRHLSLIGSKILIIFHNSIGFKNSDIERIISLIHPEESSVVIVKSDRNKVILTCSYEIHKDFEALFDSKRNYSAYLSRISSKDIFIHTLDGFFSIDDFEDVKKLYIELSKKESLSYCSSKMHESFNDLFVEYKEQLND